VAGAGNVLASANRKLFTGHEYDPSTGLYYAKARYYDPDQGRFLTQDAYLGERWEQTVMFGRPSDPLLALSYDEGALGADVALAVAPFGGTGAVRSLGTVATGRVSSTVARTSRAMLVGGRATRGPPLPNAALRPGVALEDAWAGSVGAARARSVVVERPVPTPRTILGNEVGAPLVRESPAAGATPNAAGGATRVLPAARQIEAAWGASTYRHGGLMNGLEHIMYRNSAGSGVANVGRLARRAGTSSATSTRRCGTARSSRKALAT